MGEYGLVDLFAGVGGLHLAARSLGVLAVGIECDADACATRQAAGLPTVKGDVRAFAPTDFPYANVLVGAPPCQTFSVGGQGAGRRAFENVQHIARLMADREDITRCVAELDDPRTGLVLEPLRWALAAVDDGHPYESVVLEQVPSVLPVWKEVGNVLLANGYSVAHGVLSTEEFGVPQTRRRAVLIARRHGTAALPKPTHRRHRKGSSVAEDDPALLPWVTMGEVLNRGEPFVLVSNYGSAGDPRVRGRRTSDEPAPVVTGKVNRNRVLTADGAELDRLSPAEAGRLQSFPADYPWAGKDISQQIGNATPPLLAELLLTAALDIGHSHAGPRTGGEG
ncbi:DNA cytosine methyltransferase [Streptomyces sp. C3-3]|uniref:DNA cytosine methyltransferase n=1 Tax=Streptomyces sp. C3-3 TaxID=2824901 RepID=UPI001B39690C|nr:DNA cytosine methyltransferase [Streptomyces sp. C3-3]MBQ1113749.1 DNA cytosine methyltransferase [Streptomyces sp. C3-3]